MSHTSHLIVHSPEAVPATIYQSRGTVEQKLHDFWKTSRFGVMVITGEKGSGKSVMLSHFMAQIPGSGFQVTGVKASQDLPAPAAVFAWNFQHDPDIKACLQRLYIHLTGDVPAPDDENDLVKRLITYLENTPVERVLIILDGLSTIDRQTRGGYGLLLDQPLVDLIQRMAKGIPGIFSIIVSCTGVQNILPRQFVYHAINTGYFDRETAIAMLKLQGIKGSDSEISNLASTASMHAYTLHHLGELVKTRLNGLASRAEKQPHKNELLEELIVDLLEARMPDKALTIYQNGMGGFFDMVLRQAEYQRGMRITEGLLSGLSEGVETWEETGLDGLLHEYAIYLLESGYVRDADRYLRKAIASLKHKKENHIRGSQGGNLYPHESLYRHMLEQDRCEALILLGKLPEAEHLMNIMISGYESNDVVNLWGTRSDALMSRLSGSEFRGWGLSSATGSNPYARRAITRMLQGNIKGALQDFKKAQDFQNRKLNQGTYRSRRFRRNTDSTEKEQPRWQANPPLTGMGAIHYARLLTALGKLDTALKILLYHQQIASGQDNYVWPLMGLYADICLSDVYRLKGLYKDAHESLTQPLSRARKTTHQEMYCRANLSLARLEIHQNHLDKAEHAIKEALTVAEECEFKLEELDCTVTQARIEILRKNYADAFSMVKNVPVIAGDPECNYPRAHAAALQIMGEAESGQNNPSNARRFLEGAAAIRERISDPHLHNTRNLLLLIPEEVKEKK